MTKEEAIHFAECLKHNYTINFADMEVFCDMAIEALEQEPCKSNKKEYYSIRFEILKMLTILKEQAIYSDSDTLIKYISLDSFDFVIDSAIKLLKQEPKTGHWVIAEEFGFGNICECSECKESVWIYKDTDTWNYCPKCGLKMEEK